VTLSPVFRSAGSIRLLREEGIWARLRPDLLGQARAVARLRDDLEALIDPRYLADPAPLPGVGEEEEEGSLAFLQEYFFLILFRSLFRALGVEERCLRLYTELNFCIKGTITAADNLFDDQGKSLLPLDGRQGSRFLSILQLMCFERLLRGACDRAEAEGILGGSQTHEILRGLMTRMAEIGELEGSEEEGVDEIPEPDVMVERVHRVRGGALFALAFVAPAVVERGESARALSAAEPAISRLGTAFQIVDDLTDFEFDLGRRSHNLLVSQVHHQGEEEEREVLEDLLRGATVPASVVEESFPDSARAVLERAYREAQEAFRALASLGFWFPPHLAREVVRAIVGLEGVARMEHLTTAE